MKPTPEKYLNWLEEGKTFEHIRKDLVSHGKTEDEIKEWIDLVSRLSVRTAQKKEVKKFHKIALWVGAALILGGLLTIALTDTYQAANNDKAYWRGILLVVVGSITFIAGLPYFKRQ